MRIEPRANVIWSYDTSLSPEPLIIELTEINGKKAAQIHNPGWTIQKVRNERNRILNTGIEELDDLECGGHYRQEALEEIWENANKAFEELVTAGYSWEDALRLARENDCRELDYLDHVELDKNGLLRRERMNAFDEIERREAAKAARRFAETARAESAHESSAKKKFCWPWRKHTNAAMV